MTSCPGGGKDVVDEEVEAAVAPLRGCVKLVFGDLGQVRQPDGAAISFYKSCDS